MPRGSYKRYLHRYGDGVIPRSTHYKHLQQLRKTLENERSGISVEPADNILQTTTINVDESSSVCVDQNTTSTSSSSYNPNTNWSKDLHEKVNDNLWLYDDYNEQTREDEIWFDVEELPSVENSHGLLNNEPAEMPCDHSSNTSNDEDSYNQPLCNCTSITRGEALLMTLLLGVEESLTWKSITAILSLINTLFGRKVVLDSKFTLFKALQLNEKMISFHMYCNNCMYYLGVQNNADTKGLICENCGNPDEPSDIAYFITLNMMTQLKITLQDPEVQQALFEHFEKTENIEDNGAIKNITDGQIYKKLCKPNNPLCKSNNLTYTFNTDGCQKSKSSKISTWPIFAVINELPIKLQKKHMIMSGIWVNNKDPDMLLFLKPFVDEANELSDKGIKWTLRNKVIKSKFIPICSVVDSVARCKLLNMKQFNGFYGCTFCEHPTNSVDGSRRFCISTVIPKDRTDASIKKNMELAAESEYGTNVMGIWGPSALMNLKYFDIADGMSPDYMHAFLIGAVKQHTNILLTSFGKDYYVGNPNQLNAIDERLLNFKHPTCITRSSRTIKDREMWKANEWRSWLLFYCLICMKDILPSKYFNHLALLVEALSIMLSGKIKVEELRTAGDLLTRYVVLYQDYFGKAAMTYNIHLLLHVEKSVLNLGPLWYHSTFIFENENHFILKMQKSPTHLALQIARRFIFEKSVPALNRKLIKSNDFNIFCERNLTGRLKKIFQIDGCTLIGKGQDYQLTITEQKLFKAAK
ncbi:uncharacterized protein LOC141532993 [Cotesia typhae]|uniref:uncharacterized protein LOC141532993 n=2 Tax=Cotesia typhae TaxID=2053667 RepID=UPI003D680763